MSKLRVEGSQGWNWSHFLLSLKAFMSPIHSMTGTPKEIEEWLHLETFKPLTKSGRRYLRWMIQEGNPHSEPKPLIRDGVLVGFEMALPEALGGPRVAIVGLKQDEENRKIEFMTASINYKSWENFLEAAKNSRNSSSVVAQCEKRMWTSGLNTDLNELHRRVRKLKPSSPKLRGHLNFDEQRSSEWHCDLDEDHLRLYQVVEDLLPITIVKSPEKLTDLCDKLPIYDCDKICEQLRQLTFVGGAQEVWVNSKSIGFTYFVWDNGAPLTSFWYKKAGEKGWVREVRRKNRQSDQYEYAAQKLETIKLDEPIPQTFGGPNESLILPQIRLNKDGMLLNEIEHENIPPWLQPPSCDNVAETESTTEGSETDSF